MAWTLAEAGARVVRWVLRIARVFGTGSDSVPRWDAVDGLGSRGTAGA
jgi:hypothetical protein